MKSSIFLFPKIGIKYYATEFERMGNGTKIQFHGQFPSAFVFLKKSASCLQVLSKIVQKLSYKEQQKFGKKFAYKTKNKTFRIRQNCSYFD